MVLNLTLPLHIHSTTSDLCAVEGVPVSHLVILLPLLSVSFCCILMGVEAVRRGMGKVAQCANLFLPRAAGERNGHGLGHGCGAPIMVSW